jgi:hypothetical protein
MHINTGAAWLSTIIKRTDRKNTNRTAIRPTAQTTESMQKKSPEFIQDFSILLYVLTNKFWPSIGTNFKAVCS